MHARARVESVESIRQFRAQLWQFAEEVGNALTDAEADVRRTQQWLEQEQGPWWRDQLRKRHDARLQAKLALEDKRRYKTIEGSRPAAVEEEQALRLATRRYEEAERRLEAVKQWRRKLDREATLYHGIVQRLSRAIETGVPQAAATLDRLTEALAAYLALQAPQSRKAVDALADDEQQGMGLPASLVDEPGEADASDAGEPAADDDAVDVDADEPADDAWPDAQEGDTR